MARKRTIEPIGEETIPFVYVTPAGSTPPRFASLGPEWELILMDPYDASLESLRRIGRHPRAEDAVVAVDGFSPWTRLVCEARTEMAPSTQLLIVIPHGSTLPPIAAEAVNA